MKMIHIVFLLGLISTSISHASSSADDFCVADLKGPETPSGFLCKNPKSVTADDFVFTGLRTPTMFESIFKVSNNPASVYQFPGLNGLDVSATRVDMLEEGVVPMHTHPRGTELLHVMKGNITAGFITSDSKTVYVKALEEGDIMVFPKGLLHFQLNSGKGIATVFVSYNNQNPGLTIISKQLFANNLNSSIVTKTTAINPVEVKRLKIMLRGSG